jgi:hypothetical protein
MPISSIFSPSLTPIGEMIMYRLIPTKGLMIYVGLMKAGFYSKALSYSLLVMLFASISACQGDNKNSEEHDAVGYWSAPAYGQVIAITSSYTKTNNLYDYNTYHITDNSCIPESSETISFSDLSAYLVSDDFATELEIIEPGQTIVPGVRFERIDQLPVLCQPENISIVKGEAGYSFDPKTDLDIFWSTLDQHYLDFSLSNTNWAEIYEQAILELSEIESEEELFNLFSIMITPLQDTHNFIAIGTINDGDEDDFSVSYKPDFVDILLDEFLQENELDEVRTEDQAAAANQYIGDQLDIYTDTIFSYANESTVDIVLDDNIAWFITDDNIGYLMINAMANFEDDDADLEDDLEVVTQVMDTALMALKDVNGLIIDVRLNEGGQDEVSMLIAQRFMSARQHVYSKQARLGSGRTPLVDVYLDPATENQYLGPIVLLSSATTVSAAEVFILAMRNLPNVTIIGESTQGAFSDVFLNRVTSDIAFGFSNEYYLSSTGEWFEHQGIPVDIEVPFLTLEQREQERDYAMEEALGRLQ